ncbi:zinc finger, LSD1 subclass family protein, partial (macronuclear) [Tetrahymena thermophila SB210]
MLFNFIVLIYTIYSLCRGIYIKYFKVRFIVSKVQETEVSIKWKQIRNNFKLKRYIISKKNAPIPLSVNEILNQSADISQFSSYSSKNFEEKSDCINELSIKWQINPLKVREIALPKIQK